MPAPTHTRSTSRPRGVGASLPWWALALPALAFTALLLLVLDPAEAHAATGEPAVMDFLRQIRQALLF
ncbi:hypothetical protein ACFQVC_21175 [Streptomyces monticola]|uniref:Uncharacterized protein n=1 Tax=Streptomyces monticola TaxID=2666263 RepID=A0ABW2JN09_9ACTN